VAAVSDPVFPSSLEAAIIYYCRGTRGWKPTAVRYSMSVHEVKKLMRKNALLEKTNQERRKKCRQK